MVALRPVGVRTSIGHRKHAGVGMRIPHTFVIKLVAVDAATSCAVSSSRVSTLHHKVLDDAMELVSFVMEIFAFLPSAVDSEIFGCLWHSLVEQLHHYSALLVSLLVGLADLDVEIHLLICSKLTRK